LSANWPGAPPPPGSAGASNPVTSAATAGGFGTPGRLRWCNWPLYLDLSEDEDTHPTLERFIAESGIDVTYSEDIDDNNVIFAKVKNQLDAGVDTGYDLYVLTDWMASRWKRQGYLQSLDRQAIPNAAANLIPRFLDVDFDPQRDYSIPWAAGFVVLAWNKQLWPQGLKSVDDLWQPELKGRVEVVSEMTDTLGTIMFSQGVDPSGDWGEAEFANALDLLAKQVSDGQIRDIKGNSYVEDMVNGDAVAVLAWSGDTMQLNYGYEPGEEPYGFAVPEAGSIMFSDNFTMPAGSGRLEEAQALINFYYYPEVAAEVAAWVNSITPVEGAQAAMAGIAPELADNQLIFPDETTLSQVAFFRSLTPEEDEEYNARFLEVTGV
jgi:spermidine/putrescine transport system substrate-binding protein